MIQLRETYRTCVKESLLQLHATPSKRQKSDVRLTHGPQTAGVYSCSGASLRARPVTKNMNPFSSVNLWTLFYSELCFVSIKCYILCKVVTFTCNSQLKFKSAIAQNWLRISAPNFNKQKYQSIFISEPSAVEFEIIFFQYEPFKKGRKKLDTLYVAIVENLLF